MLHSIYQTLPVRMTQSYHSWIGTLAVDLGCTWCKGSEFVGAVNHTRLRITLASSHGPATLVERAATGWVAGGDLVQLNPRPALASGGGGKSEIRGPPPPRSRAPSGSPIRIPAASGGACVGGLPGVVPWPTSRGRLTAMHGMIPRRRFQYGRRNPRAVACS